MAGNNDIQATMSTKIEVDTQKAGNSVQDLINKFKDLVAERKANEAVAKAEGDSIAAAKAHYEGLTKELNVQKELVDQLKRRRESLQTTMRSGGTVTKEQTDDLKMLDRQLSSASSKVVSLSNQQERARHSFEYVSSGLKSLKNEYYNNNRAIQSNVEKLKAEGQTAEAQKAKLSGLKISLENLSKQQKAAKTLADEAAKSEGKNSAVYLRRITDYNKISAAIAKAKTESKELSKAMTPPKTTAWTLFRDKILKVDSAEKQMAETGQKIKGVFSGAFLGSLTGNVLPAVQTGLQGIVLQGTKAAQTGMAIQARWKNMGVAARGVKQLTAQVTELREHSNLTVQTINNLQTRFYGMTKSVSQTKALTQGVASLADSMKLSEQQANGFANGLNRIESSGKVTSASLGRLQRQAPGLATQLAKAAGMSQKQFNNLVASGKMTTDQFNKYLMRASKNYDVNAKAFTKSAAGSAHSLQQEWQVTQAALAKPLVKVEATGLNELRSALSNKDTQRGLQMLATGMAKAAVEAAKLIGYLAKHQNTVKIFGVAILSVVGALKAMRTALGVKNTIVGFIDMMKKAKEVQGFATATRALGVAFRFMTGPIGIAITVIAALGTAFAIAYKKSATFRKIVNGIGKSLVNVGKYIANAGKNIVKSVGRTISSIRKSWENYQKQRNRQSQQLTKQEQRNQRQQERQEQVSARRRQRAWNNFWKSVGKNSSNGWKSLMRNSRNGLRNSQRTWQNLGKLMSKSHNSAWRDVLRRNSSNWRRFGRDSRNGSNNVSRAYVMMRNHTSRTLQTMAREHPRTFGAMYKQIEDRSKTWHDITNGHWNRLGNDIANQAKDISNNSRSVFGDMYDKLNSLTGGGLDKMRDTWNSVLNDIHNSVVNIGGHIHNAFDNLMNGLIDVFKGLINGIVDGINWVIDHVGGSGHLARFSIGHFANGTNGPIEKDQLAVVNDAPDSEYRELVHKKRTGETFLMPAKRNILMPLEKGDEVLDGHRSKQLLEALGRPIHYAGGAIGSFFEKAFNTAKDAADDAMDWVDDALKNVVGFGKELFEHFTRAITPKSNDSLNTGLKINLPGFFGRSLQAWLKKQLESLQDDNGKAATPEMIRKAAARMGIHDLSDSFVNLLMGVIMTESGNRSIRQSAGVQDVNARSGDWAAGILQYTNQTFMHYAMPGHTNRYKPFDELLAFFNNSDWRNSIGYPGYAHGKPDWLHSGPQGAPRLSHFADGGIATKPSIFGEAGPEMAIPLDASKRGRAYDLLAQVMAQFKSEESPNDLIQSKSTQEVKSLNKKFDALLAQNQQLIGLIDKLIGVTDSANNPTARYKRTQRDINMARAQSFV